MTAQRKIEVHGHRGARGYFPENTIISFIEAVKLGVDVIELDVVISHDKQVVVSHEAWMNGLFCFDPEGRPVAKDSREYNLYQMNYADIKKFDCGKGGNPDFPLQKPVPSFKPLLSEIIKEVDAFTEKNDLAFVKYNIEIKTEEQEPIGLYSPEAKEFVKLVQDVIEGNKITGRTNLQSFDVQIMQEIKRTGIKTETALLVENTKSFEENMNLLGFVTNTYSPEFILVNGSLVQKVKQKGMKLIPWTVNEISDMKRMVDLGVDGIITDYPDRAIDLVRK